MSADDRAARLQAIREHLATANLEYPLGARDAHWLLTEVARLEAVAEAARRREDDLRDAYEDAQRGDDETTGSFHTRLAVLNEATHAIVAAANDRSRARDAEPRTGR